MLFRILLRKERWHSKGEDNEEKGVLSISPQNADVSLSRERKRKGKLEKGWTFCNYDAIFFLSLLGREKERTFFTGNGRGTKVGKMAEGGGGCGICKTEPFSKAPSLFFFGFHFYFTFYFHFFFFVGPLSSYFI